MKLGNNLFYIFFNVLIWFLKRQIMQKKWIPDWMLSSRAFFLHLCYICWLWKENQNAKLVSRGRAWWCCRLDLDVGMEGQEVNTCILLVRPVGGKLIQYCSFQYIYMCCPKDVVCCLCADRNLQGVKLLLLHIMLKLCPCLQTL